MEKQYTAHLKELLSVSETLQHALDEENDEQCRMILLDVFQKSTLRYPSFIRNMATSLFVELAEIICECAENPEDITRIRDYIKLKIKYLTQEQQRVNHDYIRTINQLSHHTVDGKSAQHWTQSQAMVDCEPNDAIVALNLKYWDVNYLYHSYQEGYHYHQKQLYYWLLSVLVITIAKYSN